MRTLYHIATLPQRWGNWTLDSNILVHANGHYDIALTRVRTDADVEGWLRQVAIKQWATTCDLDSLAEALFALVGRKAVAA